MGSWLRPASDTATLRVIDGYLLAPASESARVQLTVCAETEHVHPVPDALVGVRPRGSVSLTVTTPLVAPRRLMSETVIVKLAPDPRVKLPTWLLLKVRSGEHSAEDCIPVTCDNVAIVELVPAAPGVAPYATPGVRVVPFPPPSVLMLAAAPETKTTPPAPPPPGP